MRRYKNLVSLTALATLLFSPFAIAQDDADERIASETINVEAQPLAAALKDFSDQTGLQVAYVATLAENKTSKGAENAASPVGALDEILDSTGLEYQFVNDETVAIGVASDERGDSDSKNLSPTPVLMAQNAPTQTSTMSSSTSTSDDGATSIVSGKVTDARTGANLKGASVTIEETGQSTSTNDLGVFRFSSVVLGDYTLRISYLGYAEQSAAVAIRDGRSAIGIFALVGGTELEEIVVYGLRSARAQALNQERSASVSSTVLAADFLGQFDGATISEALRRAPGIAFEEDPLTGDGTNVIVRGLEPDLNQVTLNGLRLPEGSGIGRSANLGNILTESIAKVTISKSLLPSQDGSGAGGLIEIETKAPFDRPRRYANFSAEGGKSGKDFVEDYLLSGTVSGTFGDNDDFGLSASVQYRERDIEQFAYNVVLSDRITVGQYLPLDDSGLPATNIFLLDPRTPFPFEPGIDEIYPSFVNNDYNSVESSNLSITLSGQWQIADHTNLKFDYTRADETRDTFFRSFAAGTSVRRELLPIDELGGELRFATVSEDVFAAFGFPGMLMSSSHTYRNSRDKSNISDIYSFRGESNPGKWELDYRLGFSSAGTKSPRNEAINAGRSFTLGNVTVDPSLILPEGLNNTVDGRMVHLYAPLSGDGYPLPLFNQGGFDFFNDSTNYLPGSSNVLAGSTGNNDRYTARLSSRYNFDYSHLKYIEGGVFYEEAEFTNLPGDVSNSFSIGTTAATIGDLGLVFADEALADIGLDGGFHVISEADIRSFFDNIENNSNAVLTPVPVLDARFFAPTTNEEDLAAYLQGRVDIGKLEIVGGLRLERVDIEARNLTGAALIDESGNFDVDFFFANSSVVDQVGSQTEILPRIAMTYRQSDNLVFRAAYGVTVARPQIQNLSDVQSISIDLRPIYGLLNNQPSFQVSQGNPDLKPARTTSYDFSAEYYFEDVGLVEVSLFYKKIKNMLELEAASSTLADALDGLHVPDDPRIAANLDNFRVSVTTPRNNENAGEIWGIEAAFEKQLTFLPGALSGFGVFANYTYTDSRKTQPFRMFDPAISEFVDVDITGVPFRAAPKHSGTGALTYNKFGVDATLSYTTQARRLSAFQRNNLHQYNERDDSLDFRAEYRIDSFGGGWRVWIAGSDLLKGRRDPDVEISRGGTGPTPTIHTGGNFLGGRVISLGLAKTF